MFLRSLHGGSHPLPLGRRAIQRGPPRMLGRRPVKDGASRPLAASASGRPAAAASKAKKRKWEESDDEESQEKITKDDIEQWKATMQEEELEEQRERDRREKEAREADLRKKASEEEQRRRREEEEAEALRENEALRKATETAEAERRRLEEDLAPAAVVDVVSVMPSGIAPGKEHLYKTSYCKRWEQGNCNFGSSCHFAHGERELRGKPPKGSPPGTLSVALPPDVPRPHSGRTLEPPAVVVPPSMAVQPPDAMWAAGGCGGGAAHTPQVVLPPHMQSMSTPAGTGTVVPPKIIRPEDGHPRVTPPPGAGAALGIAASGAPNAVAFADNGDGAGAAVPLATKLAAHVASAASFPVPSETETAAAALNLINMLSGRGQ
eukprot:TRINITY_DN15477_c0_g5_i1.p1 TRINITY_DN15477_c0_g5~~TRINITY_DN15477_c0_g5_i1.p1  ORF type:complete len:378 (-),score=100.52 TRINITY_DN15477_c0_g5_i1:96-1229(-)